MDISSMLEVQVNEVKEADIKENVTPKDLHPSTTSGSAPISEEESNYYKVIYGNDISAVRYQKLHCTACDTHIGSAPADSKNMFEHPILRTLLCAQCREFYGDGTFEQGDDATDMFCRWCANGGNLYCCSFCSNTFCSKCIKRNFDPVLRRKIEADEKWKCFVCDPTDLYSARATCWALLEYVQRMNRLFQKNCKMTQLEVDEKINLDETKCCPRKRKRKRRRIGSVSEDEDDVTYSPNYIPVNPLKRKRRGRKPKYLYDSNTSNVSQSGASEDSSVDHSELLPSLFSCEQTMIEGENATINTDDVVVSQTPVKTLAPKVDTPLVLQPTIYGSVVNVVQPIKLMPPTSASVPIRQSLPGSLNQIMTVHCTSTPMVTIPTQNTGMLNTLHIKKYPPAESRRQPSTTTPSVIEIESDSEEGVDVGPSRNSRSFKDHVGNNKAVPVALLSSKNNYSQKKQDLSERRNVRTLNQRLLPYSQEVDSILTSLKMKLQDVFAEWKHGELKKSDANEGRSMIKQFHREMRETVALLACINDRVVREYNRWKRLQVKAGVVTVEESNEAPVKIKRDGLPLDMVCINESDTDADSDLDDCVLSPSEFVGSTSVVPGASFRKRITVSRSVGDDSSALLVDKSVQIYDVELRDYDKCIRQSSINVSEHQSKTQDNPSTSSTQQSDKYEEQFIYYLQNRTEPEDVQEEEEPKDLPDPNETPLKDLIEANSPFISEMLETMDKPPVVSNNIDISDTPNKEDNSKSPTVETTNSVNSKSIEDIEQMVNNITNTINNKQITAQERQFSTSDEIRVVNILKSNEQDTTRTNCHSINSTKSCEDNCSIIDD